MDRRIRGMLARRRRRARGMTLVEIMVVVAIIGMIMGAVAVGAMSQLKKAKVKRVQEGRAFRYRAVVSRERAFGGALNDLVKRMFGGSSEALLMAMVDTRQISAGELERVAKRLAEMERDGSGPKEAR